MRKVFFSINTYLLFLAFPLHAQWVKAGGPDSVRAFAYGRVAQQFGGSVIGIFAGTNDGVFKSLDNGVTWEDASIGLTNKSIRGLAILRDTVFAGTDGGVFRSTDGGVSWTMANTGLTNLSIRTIRNYGADLYVGTFQGGVFRSTNRGGTWSSMSVSSVGAGVNAIEFYSGDVYIGTDGAGVFRTSNGGATWIAMNGGLKSLNVNSLVWDASWLHAATDSGVYRLPYSSQTWQLENGGQEFPLATSALAASPAFADVAVYLFAGTPDGRVYVSDHGQSWTVADSGLTNTAVLSILYAGDYVYVGTSSGVWRRPASEVKAEITSVNSDRSVSSFVELFVNNRSLAFTMPASGHAKLSIHDLKGEKVATLFDGRISAGSHSLDIPETLRGGRVYVFRLSVGGNVQAHRFVKGM